MSKSQKTLALAAMAPHLLGNKSEVIVAQAVRGNRVGAASPGQIWELPSQEIGGVWYRSLSFTSFAAYKAAKAARARLARIDAQASVSRVDVITRPACTGGKSYGKGAAAHNTAPVVFEGATSNERLIGPRHQPWLLVRPCAPKATTAKAPKVKAKPQAIISRRVREVANHVAWCLSEAGSAAVSKAKATRKAAKAAKMEKAKGEKAAKKVLKGLKALQAAKNPRTLQGAPIAMAGKAELLRAWNRA